MKKYDPHKDTDSLATSEWIESLDSVIKNEGVERAHFILEKLIEHSRVNGVRLPYSPNTPYLNTIPLVSQEPFPGNRSIERRIKSIIGQQPLSAGEDLSIQVLRGADKATYSELNKDILNALEAQK